jgi:hypothetical protein
MDILTPPSQGTAIAWYRRLGEVSLEDHSKALKDPTNRLINARIVITAVPPDGVMKR